MSELGSTFEIEEKDFHGVFESELLRLADPEVARSPTQLDAALQATATSLARRGVPLSQLLAVCAWSGAAATAELGDAMDATALRALSSLDALRARAYARAYSDLGEAGRGRCGAQLVPLRRGAPEGANGHAALVGSSPALERAREAARLAARSRQDVLITGEEGAGKETLARFIHELAGEERAVFVPVACKSLPTHLAGSELFGHKKNGSPEYPGLFRAAMGGTLFLRELTELSPEVQAKLVRVLEERMVRPIGAANDVPVDVRVVASTSRDIESAVASGELRSDLIAKFVNLKIHLAPLRERREDIEILVEHFLTTFCHRRCGCIWGVSQRALDVLLAARWTGNARELRNAIEHAVTHGEGDMIEVRDLPAYLTRNLDEPSARSEANASDLPSLAEAESQLIRTTLGHFGGNKVRAAMSLGISRHKLYDRLRKLGIQ